MTDELKQKTINKMLEALDSLEQKESAIVWHYSILPPSNPYKKYIVVYAPWDYNYKRNERPRFSLADYYPGEEPNLIYKNKPWHFDCCHSAETREILAWADIGEVGYVLNGREVKE